LGLILFLDEDLPHPRHIDSVHRLPTATKERSVRQTRVTEEMALYCERSKLTDQCDSIELALYSRGGSRTTQRAMHLLEVDHLHDALPRVAAALNVRVQLLAHSALVLPVGKRHV
jgi:hypothetical protein